MNKLRETELNKVLTALDAPDSNKQQLGYEALAIIKESLVDEPNDIDTLVLKMRINSDIFENATEIIGDAESIIDNDAFTKEKMVGYDWLYWVYNEVMGMPNKASDVIEDQLLEVQSYKVKYEKERKESELMNKFAFLKHQNGEEEVAMRLWLKSYDKFPYLVHRNGHVGMMLLDNKDWPNAEKLLMRNWNLEITGHEVYDKVAVVKKLKQLLDANEINDRPHLIGLYYNLLRNTTEHFGLHNTLDFHDQHLPALEEWGQKFPDISIIWVAIGNTYLLDSKNYEKAFLAYKQTLEGDNPHAYLMIKRVNKSAKKSNNAFTDLDIRPQGNGSDMYDLLTSLSNFSDKAKNKKKKLKLAKMAVDAGEEGYKKYVEYLINGEGNAIDNEPYKFAMLCNNYGNALGSYAKLHLEEEALHKVYNIAGDIHIQGYEMQPFMENIENASQDYFKGKNFEKSIESSKRSLKDYKEDFSVYDVQFHYWQITLSYIELKDRENAEIYYKKAKALYLKVGGGSKEGTQKFIFTSKLFFEYVVVEQKDFFSMNNEMAWFVDNEVALKQEAKEHGLVSYYLGVAYKETNKTDAALASFQTAVDHLQDLDWGFYDQKCDNAIEYIKELGGKAIVKEEEKESTYGRIKSFTNALLFPFMILAMIGGLIYAAATGQIEGKKNKKK